MKRGIADNKQGDSRHYGLTGPSHLGSVGRRTPETHVYLTPWPRIWGRGENKAASTCEVASSWARGDFKRTRTALCTAVNFKRKQETS